jgi:hypothetical protein
VILIVLLAVAGLLAGIVVGAALSRWAPAFPALFFVGVLVFLGWSIGAAWDGDGVDWLSGLTALFALLGWIAGIVLGIGVRRTQRRRDLARSA